ncbi:MAG: tRNA (adenosine(37)-N6)-dimethylallyltransferase MiaA [Candidatus Baltobacteraceae bacterium]
MFYRAFGQFSGSVRTGVLIVAGPTASGKTEAALALAQRFDAEIVGADSRQIYRGMDVGTAAPTAAQRSLVPHHLVGFLDPSQRYSAARFVNDAIEAIQNIHARGKRAIVAGGTGFYIRALTGGIELAAAHDETLRLRLAREARMHDAAFLHAWLSVRDARRAAAIVPADTYRVLRALEVALAPAQTHLRTQPLRTLLTAGIPFAKVFLEIDPAVLHERIVQRTRTMLEGGLLEEAERIGAQAVAADAVGYPQALAYLEGRCTRAELCSALVRATRRYAKRQQSWFKREAQTLHLRADALEAAAREKLAWV